MDQGDLTGAIAIDANKSSQDNRRHSLSRQPGKKNNNSQGSSSSESSSSESSSSESSSSESSLSESSSSEISSSESSLSESSSSVSYSYSGPPGPAGPSGATGATGAGLAAFAYVFNTVDGTVLAGTDVRFSNNLPGVAGITHNPGTAQITVVNAGKYNIEFTVYVTNNIAQNIGVAVNNTVVARFNNGTGSGELQGMVMLNLNAGNVVTIRNTDNNNYLLTAAPNISAYVSIFKVN